MKTKIKIELDNVQRTLFLPVWARPTEPKKDRPILINKTSEEIIESVDFDFSSMSEYVPEISQIA